MGSTVRIIFLARHFNLPEYGFCESNRIVAKRVYDELKQNERSIAYVSNTIRLAMQAEDWVGLLKLENEKRVYVYDKNGRNFSMHETAANFKKWKDEEYPEVGKIKLIMASPIQKEFRIVLRRFFLFGRRTKIRLSFFPEVKNEDWFWRGSAIWWTRHKRLWKLRKRIVALMPWCLYEKILS